MLAQVDFGPTAQALTAALIVAGPVAVLVTKVVDLVRNLFDKGNNAPSWVWNVVALGVGVAVALAWGVNVLAPVIASVPALSDMAGTQNTWGQILTGLMLGGMAGFWHDKMAQWAAAHKGVTV